jgi:hypothetical protein
MDSIKQKLQDPETITQFFLDTPKQLVRRLTFFDETQYGDGINLYFISKKTCTDAAQALCTAWLLEYLWEEDNEKFVFSEENCKETADYYIQETARYTYNVVDECTVKNYISSKIDPIIRTSEEIQSAEKHPEKIPFLSKSGIYVNKKYSTDKAFVFRSNEQFISGILLYEQTQVPDYRELFFETDHKYVLFLG